MPNTIIRIGADIAELKTSLHQTVKLLQQIDTSARSSGGRIKKAFGDSSIKIKQNVADIKQLRTEMRNASEKDAVIYKQRIREASAELNKMGAKGKLALAQIRAGANQSATAVKKLGTRATFATQVFNRLSIMMATTFGVFGAIRLIKNTVNVIADFEQGMAAVRAITGATGDELERLSDLAKNIGGIFSPTEITQLEVKLAKLGFTISEITEMTQGIVDLSTATGEDLGKAAELTASTIRGLGLDASKTREVVDQLGKSFVSSGLDLNKYRESIKYIAPIAKDMGIELSTIVGILGKLADRQIFGSLAGTGMRRVFIRLADSSSALSKKLGYTVKNSKDLVKAFKDLKDGGTTFQELTQLIDVRSLTIVSALMGVSDELGNYIESIDKAKGATEEMAGIQLDTLNNQIKRANTEWEAFLVTMQDSGGTFKHVVSAWADMLNYMSGKLKDEGKLINEEIDRIVKDARERMSEFVDSGGRGNLFASDIEQSKKNLDLLKSAQKEITAEIVRISSLENPGLVLINRFRKLIKESGSVSAQIAGEERKIEEFQKIVSEVRQQDIISSLIRDFDSELKRLKDTGKKTSDSLVSAFIKIGGTLQDELKFIEKNPLSDPKLQAVVEKNLKGQADAVSRHFEELLKLALEKEKLEKEAAAKKAKELLKIRKDALNEELKNAKLIANLEENPFEKRRKLTIAQNNFDVSMASLEIKNKEELKKRVILIEENTAKKIRNINSDETDYNIKLAQKDFNAFVKSENLKLQKEIELIRLSETLRINQIEDKTERELAFAKLEEDLLRKKIMKEIELKELELELEKIGENDPKKIADITTELEKLGVVLASVGIGTDDPISKWEQFAKDFEKVGRKVGQIAKSIADAQVAAANRVVSALNTKYAETQRALQAEIELNKQGFASNVELRRRELEDIDKKRQEALKAQEKAVKAQQAIESIQQAISLTSAVADMFKITIKSLGPFGIPIAIAAIAAMFAAFQALKAQATNITSYEKGGWQELNGKRHTQGGINLGVMGEAEKGEVVSVFNRGAVKKNKKLITSFTDAVNNGTKIELDHNLTSKFGRQDVNVKSSVSLDKSGQISEMNKLLKQSLKKDEVYQMGNVRIEKTGSRTRRIHG